MTATLRVEIATADDADATCARLLASGALGTWERPDRVVAWFERPTTLDDDLACRATWSTEPDRDWTEGFKATIGEVRAGGFSVVPSWLVDEHEPADGETMIVLDPGRAFGTGHHATTTLCLEMIDEATRDATPRVADVGCGSGILAIAAALRGARVTAIDIDEVAVEVTRGNAGANDVTIDARHGGVESLADDAPFDLVVANLLTDVVAELADKLARLTAGALVVSGITDARRAVALDALVAAGLTVTQVRERGGWIAARLVGSDDLDDPGPT